jgi:hypothetical protein
MVFTRIFHVFTLLAMSDGLSGVDIAWLTNGAKAAPCQLGYRASERLCFEVAALPYDLSANGFSHPDQAHCKRDLVVM